jgi:predicted nucleotidyltransferase
MKKADAVTQVRRHLAAGHDLHDIREAIEAWRSSEGLRSTPDSVISAALETIADSLKAFDLGDDHARALQAKRLEHLAREMTKIGDFAGALRAWKDFNTLVGITGTASVATKPEAEAEQPKADTGDLASKLRLVHGSNG